jgi:hypothetical protein
VGENIGPINATGITAQTEVMHVSRGLASRNELTVKHASLQLCDEVEARKISQARGLEAIDERGCSHTVQGEQQGVGLPHCIGSDTSRMDCEVGYVPPSSENDSNKITSQANNANDKGKNPVAVTNNAGLPNLKCWKRQARALKSN